MLAKASHDYECGRESNTYNTNLWRTNYGEDERTLEFWVET